MSGLVRCRKVSRVRGHGVGAEKIRADAEVAYDFFVETSTVACDKAIAKLIKDREMLLAYYDFPVEPWKYTRTANPIESTFATIRHRAGRTKGRLNRKERACNGL